MAQALKLVESPARPLLDLEAVNVELRDASPESVFEWAHHTFGDDLVLTSSFGAESALMLHLASRVIPRVRVVFLVTGSPFPETYWFAEELTRPALEVKRVEFEEITKKGVEHGIHHPRELDKAATSVSRRPQV